MKQKYTPKMVGIPYRCSWAFQNAMKKSRRARYNPSNRTPFPFGRVWEIELSQKVKRLGG